VEEEAGLVAVVEAEEETVLVVVVREAAVAVEAEENVDPGSPSNGTSREMKHHNLLRMRSIMKKGRISEELCVEASN